MQFRPRWTVPSDRIPRSGVAILIGLVLIIPAAMLPAADVDGLGDAAPVRLDPRSDGGDAVTMAWMERTIERERREVAARFARRFKIPEELAAEIHRAADRHEIPPRIAFGLVNVESSFRRNAVSYAGAVGYTQLLPSTARWLRPEVTRPDLFQPSVNLDIGFEYLRYLLSHYDGDMHLALTAYNRGPGTVDRLLERGADPKNGYARRVLGP